MTDTAVVRTGRVRARKGEGKLLRENILEAAERLLIDLGSEDAVSIRAIADAVGVSPPSIYLHFEDKESLFFAVCDRHFEDFDRLLEEAAAQASDPIDALKRRGKAYVSFGLDHPQVYRIMFMDVSCGSESGTVHDQARADVGRSAFEHLVQAVESARSAGLLNAELNSIDGALFLWIEMHGMTSLLLSVGGFPFLQNDELVDRMCDLMIRALQ